MVVNGLKGQKKDARSRGAISKLASHALDNDRDVPFKPRMNGSNHSVPSPATILKDASIAPPEIYRLFSVKGSITPRRKSVTWPVLDDTTMEIQWAATLIAAAAAWRLPSPLGRA